MSTETHSIHFETISQMHGMMGIAKPRHPLFSICRFEDLPQVENNQRVKIIADFYQIALKRDCSCKLQYGQNMFDFDEGVITCFAPKQVNIVDKDFAFSRSGWLLSIHPDFFRTYTLNQKIRSYGFFDYAVNEALILSDPEQQSVEVIFEQILKEYQLPIDTFSHDVIIAHTDVLLSYFNRYYNRQFITRKIYNSELLTKFEVILNAALTGEKGQGLPTAASLAQELNLSPKYLSDCLKQLTGQTTQQLIHGKLIELAKDFLASTELTVSEIAYRLGFEYAQSFNKLFKNKTSLTPMEYRHSFN